MMILHNNPPPLSFTSILLLLLSATSPRRWLFGFAWEVCSPERGGGACPTGNTCCAIPGNHLGQHHHKKPSSSASALSGCIPNDLGSYNGTCCHDDPTTGCAVGYMCGPEQQCFFVGTTTTTTNNNDINNNSNHEPMDPYVQVLPRYHLCHDDDDDDDDEGRDSASSFRHVYGFPVVMAANNTSNNDESNETVHLWYYSSLGDLMKLKSSSQPQIQRALILIHGAARNADDYYCVATKAAQLWQQQQQLQQQLPSTLESSDASSILVLAPRFVTPTDEPFEKDAAKIPNLLQWSDDGSGPWRYGANAMLPPVAAAQNISSFTAMDQLVAFLGQTNLFPNLRHLTIAGHSSGGQFVQRYSLLTAVVETSSSPESVALSASSAWQVPFSSSNDILMTAKKHRIAANHQSTHRTLDKVKPMDVRFVVANPSSYAYLTPLRFVEELGKWILPSADDNSTLPFNASCVPQYNEYPWGLQSSTAIVVPYKDRAVEALHNNVSALIERFVYQRQVVYLIGSVDRCNLSNTKVDTPTESTSNAPPNTTTTTATTTTGFMTGAPAWRPGEWWCNSHGLETSCMDLWQGSNRWFRHVHYMNSLKLVEQQYPSTTTQRQQLQTQQQRIATHTSNVVEGVGHDHSLIYLSTVGLQALWGTNDGVNEKG